MKVFALIVILWTTVAILLLLTDPDDSHSACLSVPLAVVVDLDNQRHVHLIRHVRYAVRHHQPRVLHIARKEASANREASLRGVPTHTGYDRDEYPPAMSDEGGAGASVRYVPSSENRSGGATMGRQLAPFCNGQAFIVEP